MTDGKRTAFNIPSLNGLRAIAVLIVFIGHGMTVPERWPGHVGVTIFFFLSGYLITTLLRREHASNGRIVLGKFYLRRAVRILPPAYVAIAASVVLGATGLLAASTTVWGVLAEVFNYTNYYLIFAGREGLPPESSMLWSLAVEEHFYLIFPAVLILLLRRRLNYRTVGIILLATAAVAPLWRVALALLDASFFHVYTGTDARFDGLLIGAAMALFFNPSLGDRTPFGIRPRIVNFVLAPIAVVVFVASSVVLNPAFRYTIADTVQYLCLIPIFWFVISRPSGVVGRLLNSRVLSHIGILSFSLYLFHRMIIALVAKVVENTVAVDLVALVLSLIVAQVVYLLVEKPLARVRHRLETQLF